MTAKCLIVSAEQEVTALVIIQSASLIVYNPAVKLRLICLGKLLVMVLKDNFQNKLDYCIHILSRDVPWHSHIWKFANPHTGDQLRQTHKHNLCVASFGVFVKQ